MSPILRTVIGVISVTGIALVAQLQSLITPHPPHRQRRGARWYHDD